MHSHLYEEFDDVSGVKSRFKEIVAQVSDVVTKGCMDPTCACARHSSRVRTGALKVICCRVSRGFVEPNNQKYSPSEGLGIASGVSVKKWQKWLRKK